MPIRPQLEVALRETGCEFDELKDDDELFVEMDGVLINLEIVDDEDRLLLYTHLGAVEDDDIETYKTLLAGNLFWRGGNGATLALDDENTGGILLVQQVAQEGLDGAALTETFAGFTEAAAAWRAYLADEPPPDERQHAESSGEADAPESAEHAESVGHLRV